MTDRLALLKASGIDEKEPPIRAAARLARTVVLQAGESRDTDLLTVFRSGGAVSPAECAAAISIICSADQRHGSGFNGVWPWIEVEDQVVAPGLPLAVGFSEVNGPDGIYRRAGDTVLREAGGREESFMSLAVTEGRIRPNFHLLWFGHQERFRLHNRRLEIEDLFVRAVLPARRKDVEHRLLRERRLRPEVLADVQFAEEPETQQSLHFARPEVITDQRWRDPYEFFKVRADVEMARRQGEQIVVETIDSRRVVFDCEDTSAGWFARRCEGSYVFDSLSATVDRGHVCLSAEVNALCDLASSAHRARLVFDLSSDLLSLQRGRDFQSS